jgi:hypothetical protein
MRQLIILAIIFLASCSGEDPKPEMGCAMLKQEAQEAFKAHRAYQGGSKVEEQRLYNIYKQLSDEHFNKRCP